MTSTPSIHINEFASKTISANDQDNCMLTLREHPDFGKWEHRRMDLGFAVINEHKTNLLRPVGVKIVDEAMTNQVHHCMCVEGSTGAYFGEYKLLADLNPGNYHFLTVQTQEYLLAMSPKFHNVHIQISRGYYSDLLCDDERWSADLKEKMHTKDFCYPGSFSMTPAMIKTIMDIFSSPLSGSLKKLMIEAKTLELVALQLNSFTKPTIDKKRKNRTVAILQEVRQYLQENFLEEHSLKSICIRFGINEFALKNGFKESFNATVFDFILSRRLDYARELLQNTDQSIQEIGTKVGYKYPNHFSTAFKNKFGITPGSLNN